MQSVVYSIILLKVHMRGTSLHLHASSLQVLPSDVALSHCSPEQPLSSFLHHACLLQPSATSPSAQQPHLSPGRASVLTPIRVWH